MPDLPQRKRSIIQFLTQWFSIISKGGKSKITTLLESRTTLNFDTSQLTRFVLLQNEFGWTQQYMFYWKTAMGRTKCAWESHAPFGTVVL